MAKACFLLHSQNVAATYMNNTLMISLQAYFSSIYIVMLRHTSLMGLPCLQINIIQSDTDCDPR